MTATEAPPDEAVVHILWINAGLSCDGDSVALTTATRPAIEEIALGALPGLPKIAVHWPLIDFECGPTGGAAVATLVVQSMPDIARYLKIREM